MDSTLIIDNGSNTVKMGYASDENPLIVQNCICRSRDRKLHLANELNRLTDVSQLIIRRPLEQGQLTSWYLQKLIWDEGFNELVNGHNDINFNETELLYTETPFSFPVLSSNTDQIVFEEYGFKSYYRTTNAALVPWNNDVPNNDYIPFQLVVDSGFECTWVIPVINGCVYWKGVKKMSIGGKFLTGYLKELISFRYYNVMDETILVNNIKEKTSYVATDYDQSLKKVSQLRSLVKDPIRRHDFDAQNKSMGNVVLDYVLPDFKTTTTGYVLQDTTAKLDSDVQLLRLYDERFAVPETFFYPELANINNKSGIIKTILESLANCPKLARPLLMANIKCVGGNFDIPGFKHRLFMELRKEIPETYVLKLDDEDDKNKSLTYSWKSGQIFVKKGGFDKVKISKQEYFEKGLNYLQERCSFKAY